LIFLVLLKKRRGYAHHNGGQFLMNKWRKIELVHQRRVQARISPGGEKEKCLCEDYKNEVSVKESS
jgi:hypothetical protein